MSGAEGDRGAAALVDTSVAIALCVASHERHRAVSDAVEDLTLGLSGHAAFETFSVLTRLPHGMRVSPAAAARLIGTNFPATRHLSAGAAARVLDRCVDHGIAGGAVYDALVAACAQEHGLPLVTCDQRTRETYVAVGVELIVVA